MTLVNLAQLETQLTNEEGRRSKLYSDSVGIPSIGIGRNLRDVGLRDVEIEFLFQNDIAQVQHDLATHLPWIFDLDEVRLRTFYDLCFNMGIGTLLGFKHLLAAAALEKWDDAADELQNSRWFIQVGTRGPKLVAMLRTGQDQ